MRRTITLVLALLAMNGIMAQAPAFPGAEGHGRYVTGGRGGTVIHVTNLNDSGPGSLREAVSGNDKKIIVFDVGGVIPLSRALSIGNNTTIEGQTAPSPGITIRYFTVSPDADNLIVRFIRARRGQEKNVKNAAIAKMNLFLHGASDFCIRQGDTLANPQIMQGGSIATFDCVIANPPFSLKAWNRTMWSNDPYGRNIWGTPPQDYGDYVWLQHMVKSMRPGRGRMAVVLPQGVLFRGNEEGEIRRKMVERDFVEAVVTLGDKIFYGTGLSPCFLILRWVKLADRVNKILMIDGSKILTQKRAQNILTDEDVDRLYKLYADYADVEDFSRVVAKEEIAAKGYDLSVNKYVKYHAEAVRPYAEVKAEFEQAVADVKAASEKFRTLMMASGMMKEETK